MLKVTVEEPQGAAVRARVRGLLVGAMKTLGAVVFAGVLTPAVAQLSIGGGSPSYSYGIEVPPGVAGMSPKLSLFYADGGINGPVGYGWSVEGLSAITRCPATVSVDGKRVGVQYAASDKLCLDGQRLIQTDANGGTSGISQVNDAQGLGTGSYREFRTEKDSFARIRGYGYASGDSSGASGPAYFKVWTKSGQVYEYGASPSADGNTKALITAQGKTVAMAWAVARISDTLGNHIDFKYSQNDVAWGSGPTAGSPTPGHEWNIAEIQYSGNKVLFTYATRTQDAAESYHQGSKNVSTQLLQSITTYVDAGNTSTLGVTTGAVAVKTVKLGYDNGPVTKRARVKTIQECAGNATSTKCMPATSFSYAPGGNDAYQASSKFQSSGLTTVALQKADGTYGVLTGDFNGDGKTDFIRWSDTPSANQLWLSNGDGSFAQASGFNLTATNLFKSDQCYYSIAADFNGDGMTDILRIMRATSASGASCPTQSNVLYLSTGSGSFTAVAISGIDFTQLASTSKRYYNCADPYSTGYVAGCLEPGDIYLGESRTDGKNFHIIDVNGDGRLDIVTTFLPSYSMSTNPPSNSTLCASYVCTHVYLGQTNSTFVETSNTNLTHQSVYADPPSKYPNYYQIPYISDVNGDGLQDLLVATGVWLSQGDGNFTTSPASIYAVGCTYPIDFNGDGRADCVHPYTAASQQTLAVSDGTNNPPSTANFNLKTAGQELFGENSSLQQTIGLNVIDSNGDGRQDILRWEDTAANNALYLSNGDGTFSPSSTFNLAGVQLQSADGTSSYLIGDFTGHGNGEILRMQTAASGVSNNQLYLKADPTPADQLLSVTTGSGAKTSLYYVPLGNSTPAGGPSGALGARYASDRGTANAAGGNTVDVTFPMYVVATSVADSGVGTSQVTTEYSYAGLKTDITGRGLLGFREERQQSQGANGGALTVDTQYLQVFPYIGVASRSDTYNAALNALSSSNLLSSTVNVYCDKTSATAPGSASSTSPCATTALVTQPYLYQSTQTGFDLNRAALPTTVTQNTFNTSGDPLTITVTTSGTTPGLIAGNPTQTFTKATSNTYQAEDTSCSAIQTCNWVKGRLARAAVTNTVPNLLGSIATSAGTSANATATKGNGSAQTAALGPNLAFGNVNATSSATLTTTLANDGASALSVTVPTASSVSGTDFSFVSTTCGTSLPVGASCGITVKFTPTINGARSGTLSVSTGAGTKSVSLSGSGINGVAKLSFSNTALAWGVQTIGGSYTSAAITLTNSGNIIAQSLSLAIPAPFSLSSNTCGSSLGIGASCTFAVTFKPTAIAQAYSGSVSASASSASVANSVSLSGTGGGSIASLQSNAAFGSVAYGSVPAHQSVVVKNTGNQPMSLSVSGYGSPFTLASNGCTAIAGGATCNISFAMSTAAVGSASKTLTLTGATVGSVAASVSGTVTGSVATLTSGTALSLGATYLGTPSPQAKWTFRNDGNAAMTLGLSTLNSPFGVVSNGCASVAVGASCTVTVQMGTATAGSFSQTGIAISSSGQGNRSDLSLSGSISSTLATLTINPTSVSLSALSGGVATSGTITVTNGGPATVKAMSVGVTKTSGPIGAMLSVVNNHCSGATLASGGSCTFQVEFSATCATTTVSDFWNVTVGGTNASKAVTTAVTGTSRAGMCV
jgi:hypothetical protein